MGREGSEGFVGRGWEEWDFDGYTGNIVGKDSVWECDRPIYPNPLSSVD